MDQWFLMSDQPLQGLTIVVTRPREQAAKLVQRIEQAGGTPLLFPLLDITAVPDTGPLTEQISRLGQFELAIFISPNAVRYGMAAIRAALSPSPSPASGRGVRDSAGEGRSVLPPALKIATVGQGSAKALLEEGIASVIAPTERFDSEGLLALPELQDVSGWHVMIFRGDGGRELLGDTLKERGASVEYATCYQRSKPQQNAAELLTARPDAITVTSSEALGNLWDMLNDKDRGVLRSTPLFVPHARIASLARGKGWEHVHLTGSGDDGLISALVAWGSADR
jgi:uroporphyrinogen-III synthase